MLKLYLSFETMSRKNYC